jgi:hypothetical protein
VRPPGGARHGARKPAEPILGDSLQRDAAAGAVATWDQAQPRGDIAPTTELSTAAQRGEECRGDDGTEARHGEQALEHRLLLGQRDELP